MGSMGFGFHRRGAETPRKGERMRSVMKDIAASSPGWRAEIAEGAERVRRSLLVAC
jgi:hypothetical protein